MTVHLACAFLDIGGKPVTDPRTKTETSSSIPLWQCVAVAWNRTAEGASRNEPSKTRKSSCYPGMVWYMDGYTDVYDIIA